MICFSFRAIINGKSAVQYDGPPDTLHETIYGKPKLMFAQIFA